MKINTEILDEAAHWLIELNSGEAGFTARQEFDAWLRRSPEHLRAYLELLPGWEDGAALPVGDGIAVQDLIAMGRRDDANVVILNPDGVGHRPPTPDTASRFRFRFLPTLAASLFIVAVAGALSWKTFYQGAYATEIGEERTVALDDGSTVHLNAGSRIRVRYTSKTRSVEMLRGQALFDVAKDTRRPFVVEAGDTWVRAVGTQFDVNRRRRSTVVTVVEGTVAVSRSEAGASASIPPVASLQTAKADPDAEGKAQDSGLLLRAGEQVTVKPHELTPPRTVPATVVKPTEWAQRRLTFDDSTLGEVVEEFNRYNERRLVILTPELEAFPITATFSSPDPTSLVQFLETQPTMRIVATSHEIEISNRP